MKIVSLIPSATEIVFSLGLGDSLSGVTFECDYPREARSKAVVSGTALHTDEPLTAKEIDDAVARASPTARRSTHSTPSASRHPTRPHHRPRPLPRGAVPSGAVEDALEVLGCRADVISLDPTTLDEVIDCIAVVGDATDTAWSSERSHGRVAHTRPHRARCRGAAPPAAHVRAGVVGSALQRRSLGPRHDRGRGRRLRARIQR